MPEYALLIYLMSIARFWQYRISDVCGEEFCLLGIYYLKASFCSVFPFLNFHGESFYWLVSACNTATRSSGEFHCWYPLWACCSVAETYRALDARVCLISDRQSVW